MTVARCFLYVFVFLFLLAPLAMGGEVPASEDPGEALNKPVYAKVSGMQSADCEVYAEDRLFDALDLYDVVADHKTGWIKIEFVDPSMSQNQEETTHEEPLDSSWMSSLKAAVEEGCGFKLETVQREVPEAWSDGAK